MTTKIKINEPISILVNNLCNLTCSHCAGLALYDFVGTFKWKDWSHRYERWAEILEPDSLSLCGGEPYLHPELELWFDNIRRLWPNILIEIMTNGTRLSNRIELSRKFINDGNSCIVVSCHDETTFDSMHQEVLEMLDPWKDSIVAIEQQGIESQSWKKIDYYLNDKLVCRFQLVTEMLPPYHKTVENGTVYFEMGGDQEDSHNNCDWRTSYTFQHGLLFKCPPVTNYPEAKLQVKYEEAAKDVLEKYQGCDPFDELNNVKSFVDNLTCSIEVCKLCAFDKQEGTMTISRKINLDVNRKKKFRQIKINPIL